MNVSVDMRIDEDAEDAEMGNENINNMEGSSEEESELSALQDSLRRKGTNSYYYAHGLKADGPRWDGNEQPRLLKTETSQKVEPVQQVETFPSYAWSDGKKSVKIYVELDPSSSVSDENILLSSTEDSFSLRVCCTEKDYILNISDLHENISGAKFRRKESKLTIILDKTNEFSWYQLVKKKK
eukprot:CAMPEP_0182417602 /NCGR_PEP_ID=MMETSP1167-20130531/2064_1 /TAXON_ID=2988 /ORGANISM="Mallomonas Sp, Strain CCMP3275" /LENGTH=182 /DNA_ID=CAMNT_0024591283 /DNA_START=176 /DNA_END=724 /DNA_ORIENTATION=+